MIRRLGVVLALALLPACADEVIGAVGPASGDGSSGTSPSTDTASVDDETDTSVDDTAAVDPGLPDLVVGGPALFRMVSHDMGQSWDHDQAEPELIDFVVEGIARGTEQIVMVAGDHTATTANGIEWEIFKDTRGYQRDVAFGGGRFVSVGLNGRRSWSTDGWGWINVPDKSQDTDYFAVAYGDGKFIAATADHLAVSANGELWTTKPMTGPALFAAAWGADRFVLLGEEGRTVVTPDGDTILHDENPPFGFIDLCFYDGQFVALSYSGLHTSVDGVDWAEFSSMLGLESIACTPQALFATRGADILHSTNGVDWTLQTVASSPLSKVGGAPP